MKFGLENISRLCAELGHPERAFASVLVAGTNGKGSVTALVHRALVAAGRRAARYTSPHLVRVEERFVIGAREVATGDLERAAAVVRGAAERLLAAGRLEAPPTFFECATAIAFVLFREAGVEVAVLEVGLGGRLDATNVVTPVAAAITSIDFDHQAQLGDTLASIAFEKAGIVRPGIAVVCGDFPGEAARVIEKVCGDRGARLVRASECGVDMALVDAQLTLRGAHQRANARVAVCLLRELDRLGIRVGEGAVRAGLHDVDWPGRLELGSYQGADVLLDAAHNPAGARALAAYLRDTDWIGAALVFGVMRDKDAAAMLAELAPSVSAIICTTPATPRALPADALAELARAVPGAAWDVSTIADPAAALAAAARAHARIVAAGSIFLIGPLRGILRAR